mmetsp:Transcript_11881/g.36660  ORF Transcript_11881/g.36660 Transcript_11881/m.36660 type:complete len:623 (+) Transcript_11881:1-1869(+)
MGGMGGGGMGGGGMQGALMGAMMGQLKPMMEKMTRMKNQRQLNTWADPKKLTERPKVEDQDWEESEGARRWRPQALLQASDVGLTDKDLPPIPTVDADLKVVDQTSLNRTADGRCLCPLGKFWHYSLQRCMKQAPRGFDCESFPEEHFHRICQDGLICKPMGKDMAGYLQPKTFEGIAWHYPKICMHCRPGDCDLNGVRRHKLDCLKMHDVTGEACVTVQLLLPPPPKRPSGARPAAALLLPEDPPQGYDLGDAAALTAQDYRQNVTVRDEDNVVEARACISNAGARKLGNIKADFASAVRASKAVYRADAKAFELAWAAAQGAAAERGLLSLKAVADQLADAKAAHEASLHKQHLELMIKAWQEEAGTDEVSQGVAKRLAKEAKMQEKEVQKVIDRLFEEQHKIPADAVEAAKEKRQAVVQAKAEALAKAKAAKRAAMIAKVRVLRKQKAESREARRLALEQEEDRREVALLAANTARGNTAAAKAAVARELERQRTQANRAMLFEDASLAATMDEEGNNKRYQAKVTAQVLFEEKMRAQQEADEKASQVGTVHISQRQYQRLEEERADDDKVTPDELKGFKDARFRSDLDMHKEYDLFASTQHSKMRMMPFPRRDASNLE